MVGASAPEAATGESDLKAACSALLQAVRRREESSFEELVKVLGGRKADLIAARNLLEREGSIQNVGSASKSSWVTVP